MRVRVVDLLRLLAAFQMVQGHTIDAVLAEQSRSGAWFAAWSWARGLTSVAFLLVTGLAFHLATVAQLERHLRDPGAIRSRLRRGAMLIGIGYALHLPLFPGGMRLDEAVRGALVVDVLQTIGVSLWLLEATVLVLRSGRASAWVWGALGLLALGLAPLTAGISPDGPLRPLLNFVTPLGGSAFPLLPWIGHVLLGAALAPWLLVAGARGRVLRFALAALGLLVAGWLAGSLGAALLGMHLVRLGSVLAVGAVLAALERAAERLPGWAYRLAGETLVIYVVHIVIAYGSGPSLRTLVGPVLPPGSALAVAAAMLVFCAGAALAYPRLVRGLARGAEAG